MTLSPSLLEWEACFLFECVNNPVVFKCSVLSLNCIRDDEWRQIPVLEWSIPSFSLQPFTLLHHSTNDICQCFSSNPSIWINSILKMDLRLKEPSCFGKELLLYHYLLTLSIITWTSTLIWHNLNSMIKRTNQMPKRRYPISVSFHQSYTFASRLLITGCWLRWRL